MLLTHFLPDGGNGAYVIHAIATDNNGLSTTLGIITLYSDNINSENPFGAIDTPAPGESISGTHRVQGWALTPQPNKIPEDGSTVCVYVDNAYVGDAVYNIYRSDIAQLFPGYANSGGAMAYFELDTTAVEDGMHQLSWVVTDNAGNASGIGSRFFTVDNSTLYLKATLPAVSGSSSATAGNIQATPSAVKKIILITENYFRTIDVDDTAFYEDISGQKGRPVGVLFVGEGDQPLGILNLETSKGNLNILPLISLTDNTIDLGNITFGVNDEGIKAAIPEKDPVGPGKTINMSNTQKEKVTVLSNIMAAIVKETDVNGNGILDYSENRLYLFSFSYFYNPGYLPTYQAGSGSWSADNSDIATLGGFFTGCGYKTDNNQNWHTNRYRMEFPSSWNSSWERGHYVGYNNNDDYTQNNDGPYGDTHYPTDGTYIITIDDDLPQYDAEFSISYQEEVVQNVFIPFPTFHVEDGMLRRITWNWKWRNDFNGPSVTPDWFIRNVSIQVTDEMNLGTEESPIYKGERIYNSYGDSERYEWAGEDITGKATVHTIGVNNLPWTECDKIAFAYNDGFGNNHIVITFRRQVTIY